MTSGDQAHAGLAATELDEQVTVDYISPIVGYRTWKWDAIGLKSLNDEPWFPGQALEARCLYFPLAFGTNAPHEPCTCGIYAAKSIEHLAAIDFMRFGDVHGEVYLWGKVWDHRFGYRAQFAYPKTIVLPPQIVPNFEELGSPLETLITYGVDIFIVAPKPDIALPPVVMEDIPLWTKVSGFNQEGFDWIRRRHERWGIRR